MARKRGSKEVPDGRKRYVVDMRDAGIKIEHIVKYYDMLPATVSNNDRAFGKQNMEATKKKRGPNVQFV